MANKKKSLDFIKKVSNKNDKIDDQFDKLLEKYKNYKKPKKKYVEPKIEYKKPYQDPSIKVYPNYKKVTEESIIASLKPKEYNFHFDSVGENLAREQTGMRIRTIIIILLLFIGIGVTIGVINLQTRVNEFTDEVEYLTTPLDKGMELLKVVSDSGNELKTFINDWGTDIQFVNASNFIPGPIGALAKMLSNLQDTKIIKITKFVIGGAYEIVKIIVKGIGVIIT